MPFNSPNNPAVKVNAAGMTSSKKCEYQEWSETLVELNTDEATKRCIAATEYVSVEEAGYDRETRTDFKTNEKNDIRQFLHVLQRPRNMFSLSFFLSPLVLPARNINDDADNRT